MKLDIRQLEQFAAQFVERIKPVAERGKCTEADVRAATVEALADFQKQFSLKLDPVHECSLFSGRPDTVYDRVIVEYKNPSASAARLDSRVDAAGNTAVIEQIKARFHDLRNQHAQPLNALFGVGFDGRFFIFVRYRRDRWEVLRPKRLSVDSATQFLSALAGLGTEGNRAYSPDDLSDDFAAQSQTANYGVRAFYKALTTVSSPRAKLLFQQWKLQFSEACGYDMDAPSAAFAQLGEAYDVKDPKPAELFFALHSYYALVMKFIAMEVVCLYHRFSSPILDVLQTGSDATLKTLMTDWEDGSLFKNFRIRNFLEGDLFSWYVYEWDEAIAKTARHIAHALDAYNPATLTEDSDRSRDFLKQLYHSLFPRALRHSLGEYYTPDWLAEQTLDAAGYTGDPDKRMLDNACGSGTFLVMAINRVFAWYDEHRASCVLTERDLLCKIKENIIGFDLNPLAVLAARTNYLIAIRRFTVHGELIDIPVYLCDSILTPQDKRDLLHPNSLEVKTVVGSFFIPKGVTGRTTLHNYCYNIHRHITHGSDLIDFHQCCNELEFDWNSTSKPVHTALYEKFQQLQKEGKDGIWIRIIRNQFAPIFTEPVDYVVGNPPWVNWESLPEEYRNDTIRFWTDYGLFSLTRGEAQMGGGKKDLSMLMTYAAADCYLKEGGTLAYVITQTVFKTKGAGDGFRRLQFTKDAGSKQEATWYLAPTEVHDLSSFQPFEGATNRTAVFVCRKTREKFSFPIRYIEWKKKPECSIDPGTPLEWVRETTVRNELAAEPIQSDQPGSPWLTAPLGSVSALKKTLGKSDYQAHAGVNSGGANGVYWVRPLDTQAPAGCTMVENRSDIGKRKNILRVTRPIESELLHPLLRGRDVKKWNAQPSCHIILSQNPETRQGIDEKVMRKKYPCAMDYFKLFEDLLGKRAAYRKYFRNQRAPFYSMFNVGPYTTAPWKAIWKDMGKTIVSAVISSQDGTLVLPEHHVMFVGLDDEQEAHYVCAVLNSSLVQLAVSSYTTTTGISTHVLDFIRIPRFDGRNKAHRRLADLSKRCHTAVAKQQLGTVQESEEEIDTCTGQL